MSKNAIVTGGARGIGEAICRKLASGGQNIIIWDVMEAAAVETANKLAEEFGVKTAGKAVNVTDSKAIKEAVEEAKAEFGTIDTLVNNAGVTRDGLMMRMKEEDWDFVLNINLKGVFLCSQAVANVMAKQRSGSIVNIASVVGLMGNPGQANYSASKGGVIALTKTTAKEYCGRGIRCNAVAPGFIRTAMTDELSEKVRDMMLGFIPLKEFGEPEDVAKAVNFLSSDEAAYITGQVLQVDGGMIM